MEDAEREKLLSGYQCDNEMSGSTLWSLIIHGGTLHICVYETIFETRKKTTNKTTISKQTQKFPVLNSVTKLKQIHFGGEQAFTGPKGFCFQDTAGINIYEALRGCKTIDRSPS